jgi:Cdc6-like AAA superfamily ATPase
MAGVTVLEPEIQMPSIDPQMLNERQYRGYQIVVNHFSETLAGQSPPPLRMILYGEGGTGKSKVIQTVMDAFIKAGKIFD